MILQKNKFLMGIALILIACGIIFVFLILPNIYDILKINKDISNQREELERKSSLGLNIKQMSKDISEIEKNIGEINKMFIKSENELEFLTALDNLATKNKINAKSMPEFPDKNIETLTKIPLSIAINGESENLMQYLRDLESMPYYYIIETISLNGNESANINLTGYIYINK